MYPNRIQGPGRQNNRPDLQGLGQVFEEIVIQDPADPCEQSGVNGRFVEYLVDISTGTGQLLCKAHNCHPFGGNGVFYQFSYVHIGRFQNRKAQGPVTYPALRFSHNLSKRYADKSLRLNM